MSKKGPLLRRHPNRLFRLLFRPPGLPPARWNHDGVGLRDASVLHLPDNLPLRLRKEAYESNWPEEFAKE